MKSWCYRDVQIKVGLQRRLMALLLFPVLKIQISQNFKENCARNTTQIFSKCA